MRTVMIVGYIGDGRIVVVLMAVMTVVSVEVVYRKNLFIQMLGGCICGVSSGGGVNIGFDSSCLGHYQYHHHHHHIAYIKL